MAEHVTVGHNAEAVKGDGDHSHDGHGDTRKEYFKIFFFLLAMTALTVIAAKLPMPLPGKAGDIMHVTIGLSIAIVKVAAVIWIFMHIKFDNVYLRAMIFIPVFLFFVLTFALTVLGP